MRLDSRIARLEAAAAPAPEAQQPEPTRDPAYCAWARIFGETMVRLWEPMPERHAGRVAAALQEPGACYGDAVAFFAVDMVLSAIPKAEPEWFDWAIRGWVCVRLPLKGPLAMPAEVCAVLDRIGVPERGDPLGPYVDSCQRCAYQWGRGWFERCPVCDWPAPRFSSFEHARYHCVALRDPGWKRDPALVCAVCEDRDPRYPQHWGEWAGMTEAERFGHPVWSMQGASGLARRAPLRGGSLCK